MKKMHHIKSKLLFVISLVALFITGSSSVVKAQSAAPPPIVVRPVGGFSSAQDALNTLLPVVFYIGGLLCFMYLLWGAYKYVTAGDNAANSAAARQTIINAVIGIVLLGLIVIIFKIATEIANLDQMFF